MSPVLSREDYPSIVDLWVKGDSYAAIGRAYGVGRERIRQIVAQDPLAKDRRAKQELIEDQARERAIEEMRTEAFVTRLREVIDQDLRCVSCHGWVIRDIGRDSENKTCSPECAEAWSILRSFPEVAGDDHRRHMANSILNNEDTYSEAEIEWAQRMIEDSPPPNRRWLVKGSKRAKILRQYRPEIYDQLMEESDG